MPKVSVIIPVYNVEKYVTQALDSVVNQTLADIEIICVNDCTPDKSFEIVKEYASKDKRFSLLELETNQGQGVARNNALEIAKGDYIMFLDPDDWLELDACEKAYNQIVKNNNEMVLFGLYKYSEAKSSKKESKIIDYIEFDKTKSRIDLKNINCDWLRACWTVHIIYSNKFLKENVVKYADLRMNEDVPFYIKSICCTNNISILDEPLYNYRVKKDDVTANYSQYFGDVIEARKLAYEFVKNTNNKNLEKVYLSYQIRTVMNWYKKFVKNFVSDKNFETMKGYFGFLSKKYDIADISDRIDYVGFEKILSSRSHKEFETLEKK